MWTGTLKFQAGHQFRQTGNSPTPPSEQTPGQIPPRLFNSCSLSTVPGVHAAASLAKMLIQVTPDLSQAGRVSMYSQWLWLSESHWEWWIKWGKGPKYLLQQFLEMPGFFSFPSLGRSAPSNSLVGTKQITLFFHLLTNSGSKTASTNMALTTCNGLCHWHKDKSSQFLPQLTVCTGLDYAVSVSLKRY